MILSGKKALITGASRGIGAAIAAAFLRDGAEIFITARSESINDKASELSRIFGREVLAMAGDVSTPDHVKALAIAAKRHWGKVDILVNNAGLLVPARLGMIRMSDVDTMFAVNVCAMIALTQAIGRLMPDGGSVINLASIAGTSGLELMSAYSASKGAVVAFTKAAAKELGGQRIRVNAIAPGFIATEMTDHLGVGVMERNLANIRLKRIGTPADVANCAIFLASDLSSYVTGQIIGVDGGFVV